MEVNKFVIHCMTLYHLYLYGMNVRQSLMTKYLLMSFILAVSKWWIVWHDRRQVVNAPLALRHCYMSIRKSTGRHTRWQYLRHLVIRRQYWKPFAPVYGRSRNTSSVRSTSGHSLLGVWQRSTSGHSLLGVWQNTTSGLDTARVSTVYFRAWYSSGIYSLLLGLIQLGYLQSTSGLDTARVICTLLSGLIQLDVCYFAERYDRCSVPVLVIDGWT